MSVIKVDIKKDGRQIKQTYTGTKRTLIRIVDGVATRSTFPIIKTSGQVVYIAMVDDPRALPLTILTDPRLPQPGDVYTENGAQLDGVFYNDATPRYIGPRGAFYEWEIVYNIGGEFSNQPPTSNEVGQNQQPETLLTFSTSVELEDYATATDLDGEWNCNSIGEFFADPLIVKTGILNLNYSRREYYNPLPLMRDYFQAINGATYWGFDPYTLKISDISFNATETTAGTSYDVNYKIQYRPRGWRVEKANAGLYYATGAGVARALNEDGSPTEQPVLLSLSGARLAPGAVVPMKYYRVNPIADFSGLNLPNPFEV